MVATGQEMVREKNFQGQGKFQGKFKSLKEIKEKWHFYEYIFVLFPLLLLFSYM